MQNMSIAKQTERKIVQMPSGSIFFISDFMEIGNDITVRQALQRLTKKSLIIRLSQGIYYKPKQRSLLGVVYPTAEQIARAIAKRDKARIIPTGSYALFKLGLSTQIPMNLVFLTDGSARKIIVGKQKITFKKTSPRNLATTHKLTNLIIQGLKELGENNIDINVKQRLTEIIKRSKETEEVANNINSAAVWIKKIALQIIKEIEDEQLA
ncbi:MAG: hypothetical protein DRI89_02650 [Bacteroidetes bacterium]|nr:MAG: hypothetical protein DRI89_02650 [Bacteroidota bacterium]